MNRVRLTTRSILDRSSYLASDLIDCLVAVSPNHWVSPMFFGKPPWELGAFKLFAGLANWGFGMANAMGGRPQIVLGGGGYLAPGNLVVGNAFGPKTPDPLVADDNLKNAGFYRWWAAGQLGYSRDDGVYETCWRRRVSRHGRELDSAISGAPGLINAVFSDLDPRPRAGCLENRSPPCAC
jgi:hypothetical protein